MRMNLFRWVASVESRPQPITLHTVRSTSLPNFLSFFWDLLGLVAPQAVPAPKTAMIHLPRYVQNFLSLAPCWDLESCDWPVTIRIALDGKNALLDRNLSDVKQCLCSTFFLLHPTSSVASYSCSRGVSRSFKENVQDYNWIYHHESIITNISWICHASIIRNLSSSMYRHKSIMHLSP